LGLHSHAVNTHPDELVLKAKAQFCCKMWGGQLGVKPI